MVDTYVRKLLALVLTLACLAQTQAREIPAFPGAEGYGAKATGGRGGRVIAVTNLNDSGPGSLRAAVEAEGPRIVVFRVSGTIGLKSALKIRHPHITIAGQTAPGDGICLRDHQLSIGADDVIIRYIRVRLGDVSDTNADAIGGRGHKNIILDHVSASWSIDECVSIYHCENVTIQWCLISESLYQSTHVKGHHGFGGIWGNNHGSYHHNLIAHHSSRNPRWATDSGYNDYRNNVLFNWGYNSSYGGEGDTTVNIVANYYKPGPATTPGDVKYRIVNPTAGNYYVAENYVEGSAAVTADNWAQGVQPRNGDLDAFKLAEPWGATAIDQESAKEAYQSVLKGVGATSPRRDAVDARIIEEVRSGKPTFEGATYETEKKVLDPLQKCGMIDSQVDVGGWPELRSAPAPADTEQDGMPDAWEKARGLDSDDASDGAKDRNGDGYTNVEEYINALVTSGASGAGAVPSSKRTIVLEEYVFLKSPTRDCHASSLLELANGDLLCTWFGGTRENDPDVNVWLARKPKGGRWQTPVSVSDGGGETCFNPVLVQLQGGDIQIYYCSPDINTGQVIISSNNG